jgi:hypothetical protein
MFGELAFTVLLYLTHKKIGVEELKNVEKKATNFMPIYGSLPCYTSSDMMLWVFISYSKFHEKF